MALCLMAGVTPAARAQDASAATVDTPLASPVPTPIETQGVTPVNAAESPSAQRPAAEEKLPTAQPPAAISVAETPPVPLAPVGKWEGDIQAGLTASFGNSRGDSVNLGADATYERPRDKLSLSAQYLESHSRNVDSNGTVTTNLTAFQWRLGGRYDRDVTPVHFGFVGLDFSQDRIQQLALRSVVSSGLGWHLYKTSADKLDVFAGLTYREDLYFPPGVQLDNERRTRYDVVESMFGEESSHWLAQQMRFKQKLMVYPGVLSGQGARGSFDAGLQFDLNKTVSLNVKLQARYESRVVEPAEKYDVLFMTTLGVRFGR